MNYLIDSEISTLDKEVVIMGNLCKNAIENATLALFEKDSKAIKETFKLEALINEKERYIEDLCLTFLLKQHPVARDLRKISATLKMLTDLERIGDQARNISEIARDQNLIGLNEQENFKELSCATIKMVSNIIEAYTRSDMAFCEEIISFDNVIDELFNRNKDDIIKMVQANTDNVENAMFLLIIAKYYERIADHATNVAEWIEFSMTGKHRKEV